MLLAAYQAFFMEAIVKLFTKSKKVTIFKKTIINLIIFYSDNQHFLLTLTQKIKI